MFSTHGCITSHVAHHDAQKHSAAATGLQTRRCRRVNIGPVDIVGKTTIEAHDCLIFALRRRT
jgi:hypothetical protein